jgi:hypothetical protein
MAAPVDDKARWARGTAAGADPARSRLDQDRERRADQGCSTAPFSASANRWYDEAILHSMDVESEGERFRIVSAPYFCATKLDAFGDRGGGDVYHHDLEDVIALVDGRAELHSELERASEGVRRYVAETVAALLASLAFVEALPGHLPADAAGQARLPLVEARLRAIGVL